jgi:hypothetical protein
MLAHGFLQAEAGANRGIISAKQKPLFGAAFILGGRNYIRISTLFWKIDCNGEEQRLASNVHLSISNQVPRVMVEVGDVQEGKVLCNLACSGRLNGTDIRRRV